MKLRENGWPSTKRAERYKQFAEHIVELADDESWESYRHHTLSTVAKIAEISKQCRQIETKQVGKGSLEPLVEELNDSLTSDPIIALILNEAGFESSDFVLPRTATTEEQSNLSMLLLDLIGPKYRDVCEKEIIRLVTEVGSKSKLFTVTKLYASYLYGAGFSRQHIFSSANERFYHQKISRCTLGLLTDFFRSFDEEKKSKFTVVVPLRKAMAEFVSNLFSLESYNELEEFLPKSVVAKNKKFGTGGRNRLVVFKNIPAFDNFGAAKIADSLLSMAKAFVSLHPSSISPDTTGTFFVCSEKSRSSAVISTRKFSDPRKSMRSRKAETEGPNALATYVFSRNIASNEGSRIFNSLTSLSLSLAAESSESRLLSLWAAYEALLPEPTKDGDRAIRITHFVPLIVPSVATGYLRETYIECYKNCSDMFGSDFVNLVDGSGIGASPERRFADMLSAEPAVRGQLFSVVSESPVMLLRLFKLARMIDEPQRAQIYLEKHLKRIEWQLHRVYRERNSLIHKGAVSPIIDALIENAYSYYRAVFLAIEESSRESGVSQPSRALELVSKRFQVRRKRLKDIVESRTLAPKERRTEFLELVFG